jgi:hypothetical protein
MALQPSQQRIADEWFKSRPVLPCPSCGAGGTFDVVGMVAPFIMEEKAVQWGTSIPMLCVMCSNCGNVRMYSAVKMGLLGETEKEQPK